MTVSTRGATHKISPNERKWPFEKVTDGFTTIRCNRGLFGLEVLFHSNPGLEIVDACRANGFRWHPKQKLWWARWTPARIEFAFSLIRDPDGTNGSS